ncbi:MAG: hypothetical protein JWM32_2007 [Verrucomicrobia bacterium]|nr:hypothetical protein [Verrucomicrobiota bacterium]
MPATLHGLWLKTVKAQPDATALVDSVSGRSWTRIELDLLSREWAAAHGKLAANQAVVFAEPNGAQWFAIFLGLLAVDAIAVALDPGEPFDAQRSVAEKTGAQFVWAGSQLAIVTARRRRAKAGGTRLWKVTSGSTGTPKALPFTDAQMIADGRQICRTMKIGGADVNLGCIPFGHSYGLGNLVMPLLLQGTAVIVGAGVLPHALAEIIHRWRPSVFPAVPALLRGLAAAGIERDRLDSLRTVISAGAPLPPETAQAIFQRFGLGVHNFYGSSETGGITYDRTGEAALSGRSAGRPLAGVKLKFGNAGRFEVESAAVGGRGRFRPADRGELNERGELVLLGRAGRMLKIGGRRLDPSEVERALRELPGIDDVFVEPHAQRADSLAAVIATRRTSVDYRAELRERLAAWKIPRKFVTLPEFPLTARGKVDRRKLRAFLVA